MRLMTFRYAGEDHAGVLTPEGLAPVSRDQHEARSAHPEQPARNHSGRHSGHPGARSSPAAAERRGTAASLRRSAQDLVHRAELQDARRRYQRRSAGGAGQFYETGVVHVSARGRDPAAAAGCLGRCGCGRRTGRGHRPQLPVRAAGESARGDLRVYDYASI